VKAAHEPGFWEKPGNPPTNKCFQKKTWELKGKVKGKSVGSKYP